MIRLNCGCGHNKLPAEDGWINIDVNEGCEPDVVCQLDGQAWRFAEDDAVDEVLFNHSMEHMGATADRFSFLIQEIYRVCKDGAVVRIAAPHPRHDNFINDFTHVRPITPTALGLLSKKANAHFREIGAANSCLADAWGVDFEITSVERVLDPRFAHHHGQPTLESMETMNNNVVLEYRIEMKVIK